MKICVLFICKIIYFVLWSYRIFNLLKPTGHVMHQQFNIQKLYALPTLYLCVLYLSENKLHFLLQNFSRNAFR